jgi:hypothetical protein
MMLEIANLLGVHRRNVKGDILKIPGATIHCSMSGKIVLYTDSDETITLGRFSDGTARIADKVKSWQQTLTA